MRDKYYIWTDVEDEVEMRRRLPAVKTDEAIPVSEKLKEKYPAIYIELE